MAPAGAVKDPLDPQVGVTVRWHQGRELTGFPARGPRPYPVTSRQNATPGPNAGAGKSRKTVIQRNDMS